MALELSDLRVSVSHPQQLLAHSLSQKLLRECGIFPALLSLFPQPPHADSRPHPPSSSSPPHSLQLCLQLLDVLPLLTWGLADAHTAFLSAFGYPTLLHLLLTASAGSPPSSFISRAFDWFAGTPGQIRGSHALLSTGLGAQRGVGQSLEASDLQTAWLTPSAALVQVPEVAVLLLSLLPRCDVELQLQAASLFFVLFLF